MTNLPLFLAGLLGLVAAAVHGGAGEMAVLRTLWKEPLPRTRFGGPGMTRAMIHVSWHIVTVAFLSASVAMVVAATALDGDAAEALAWFGAAAFTGFAAVAVGLGAAKRPRRVLQHQGPLVLALTAALAWWAVL